MSLEIFVDVFFLVPRGAVKTQGAVVPRPTQRCCPCILPLGFLRASLHVEYGQSAIYDCVLLGGHHTTRCLLLCCVPAFDPGGGRRSRMASSEGCDDGGGAPFEPEGGNTAAAAAALGCGASPHALSPQPLIQDSSQAQCVEQKQNARSLLCAPYSARGVCGLRRGGPPSLIFPPGRA